MDGFIVVNKEKGLTSHDVVFKLRKILNIKKIGHTGTLDPDTTGVLAVAVGNATKLIQFLDEKTKTYHAKVLIGISTTTEDISGEIVEQKKVDEIKKTDVLEVLKKILEIKEQVPPIYSAVKVNGKKLYEYARANESVERPIRAVEVFSIDLVSDIKKNTNDTYSFEFKITGSKGIYIRTICYTIGELLGYPACMEELVRLRSGNFMIENSYTLSSIEAGNYQLISMSDALEMEKIQVADHDIKRVRNGMKIYNRYNNSNYPFALVDKFNKLLAIYTIDEKNHEELKILRGF